MIMVEKRTVAPLALLTIALRRDCYSYGRNNDTEGNIDDISLSTREKGNTPRSKGNNAVIRREISIDIEVEGIEAT
jgi:hypothetical protein